MKCKLSQTRLKKLLAYDPDTGIFTRIFKSANCICIGAVAGSIDSDGYNIISVDNIRYRAARLAYLYMEGYWPELFVDHRNEIRSDDRWCNLREISNSCNQKNCGNSASNTSGIRGVHRMKLTKKWRAGLNSDNKYRFLGDYTSFDDAVCARLAGEQCLNWEGCNSSSPAYKYVTAHITKI